MGPISEKLDILKENWIVATGVAGLALFLVVLVLMLTGSLDCELISLKDGVYKTCSCSGFEVTVKSTESSGEQKTVCLGIIKSKKTYK